jgi:hypothetical protein
LVKPSGLTVGIGWSGRPSFGNSGVAVAAADGEAADEGSPCEIRKSVEQAPSKASNATVTPSWQKRRAGPGM